MTTQFDGTPIIIGKMSAEENVAFLEETAKQLHHESDGQINKEGCKKSVSVILLQEIAVRLELIYLKLKEESDD